jgi:hypothetical protein
LPKRRKRFLTKRAKCDKLFKLHHTGMRP